MIILLFVNLALLSIVKYAVPMQMFVLSVNLNTELILFPAAQDVMIFIVGIVKPII